MTSGFFRAGSTFVMGRIVRHGGDSWWIIATRASCHDGSVSDHFDLLVDVDAPNDQTARADEIVAMLHDAGVLGSESEPHWLADTEVVWDLVLDDRQIGFAWCEPGPLFDALGSTSAPACPKCDTLAVDDDKAFDLVDEWIESGIEPSLGCLECGFEGPWSHWNIEESMVVGSLALRIDSSLRPPSMADAEVVERVRAVLTRGIGGRWLHIQQRL